MKISTMCTVQNRNHAERVVEQLLSAGFSNKDVSAILLEETGVRNSPKVDQTPASATGKWSDNGDLGGRIARLEWRGAIAIPELGQLLVAGPLLASLSAAAAKTVGLTDAFIRIGIPLFESRRFTAKLIGGNLLVFVQTDADDAQARVMSVINACYAVDICSAPYIAVPRILHRRSMTELATPRDYSSAG